MSSDEHDTLGLFMIGSKPLQAYNFSSLWHQMLEHEHSRCGFQCLIIW